MSYIVSKAKACSGCGNKTLIYAKKMCQSCYNKKMILGKKDQIETNNAYYKRMIGLNIIKNKGFCRCDECGVEINNPKGRNCCHVIAGSANKALYHDPINHFILGYGIPFGQDCECGDRFDNGPDQESMKVWPQRNEIIIELKRKYYEVTE